MFLLDTNVISELRKPQADANVVAWAKVHRATNVYIGHYPEGTGNRCPAHGASRPRARQGLAHWLKRHVMPAFDAQNPAGRCRRGTALCQLHVPDRANESDALIAATALVHGLTVVTRNTGDFNPAALH